MTNMRVSSYKVLVSVLISLGILTSPMVSHAAPESTTMPVPRSMDELLDKVTLVVFGELGPVIRCIDFGWGSRQVTFDCYDPPPAVGSAGLIFTEFEISVEEVLLDDGTIAAGKPIIYRSWGLPWEVDPMLLPGTGYPPSFPGDRYLFLLIPASDGSYVPSFSSWGRLFIDGEILLRSSGIPRPLGFAEYGDEPITLEDLKQALASHAVAAQQDERIYVPLIRGALVRAHVDTIGVLSFLDTIIANAAALWERHTNTIDSTAPR